ncbi:hypothetical protein MFC_01426 [Mesomycoplasma flocculare ATCC 27716]|nr:hypothetical protein MFC_01426 [Mesomycoplasma flocculare ATCC 27716]
MVVNFLLLSFILEFWAKGTWCFWLWNWTSEDLGAVAVANSSFSIVYSLSLFRVLTSNTALELTPGISATIWACEVTLLELELSDWVGLNVASTCLPR